MDKALYIHEARGLVVLRDGPSIVIREPEKADRRIPGRIISNVVVIGNVRLDAGMIALFAEQGVPITFICTRGKAIAVALPYEYRLPRHHPKQRIFVEAECNRRKFARWLKTNIARLKMVSLQNLVGAQLESRGGRSANRPGISDYDYLIRQIERIYAAQSRLVREVIEQLFRETIMSVLMVNGLDPHVGVLHRNRNYGLLEDIRDFFLPEVEYQSICFFRDLEGHDWFELDDDGYHLTRNGLYEIVQRYEERRESIIFVSEKLTEQLLRMFGSNIT